MQTHYKTIIISDVHLGSTSSKARELAIFLTDNTCDKLIMNGDIIDGWQLQKGSRWKKKHTKFFRVVLKMMEKINTEVVYIRGNHDDFLDNLLPFQFSGVSIVRDHYHYSNGKKFYVLHGDVFDNITSKMRWLAKLGDIGYSLLLWINKLYNRRRAKKGKPYFSLSQAIKQKVKTAVAYISNFESELTELAKLRNCQGVICGHIHHPTITQYNDIIYMNSGDWVESLSALVEDFQGNWKIVYYQGVIDEVNDDDLAENDAQMQ